eukprot:TRINITY_DN22294_c0_g2_i1.p1 TRINITY_DN22294_c0_g2~~TRINITY_DN22294_c0_g2_i1.p1  ORF type:complete len:841 (-),score=197.70 TRINITY_DN22294_c0_g2_i1:36-2483(-)
MSSLEKLEKRSQRDLLIGVVWVLKNANREELKLWWKSEDDEILSGFFSFLNLILQSFSYAGIKAKKLENPDAPSETILAKETEEAIFTGESKPRGSFVDFKADIEKMMMDLQSGGGMNLRGRGSLKSVRTRSLKAYRAQGGNAASLTVNKSRGKSLSIDANSVIGKIVALEGSVNVTVSSTLVAVTCDLLMDRTDLLGGSQTFLSCVLSVVASLFRFHQSDEVWLSVYALFRTLLQYFAVSIFSNCTPLSPRPELLAITQQCLRHCTFSSNVLRANAALVLYCIAKGDYRVSKSFDRFLAFTTVSIAKLVSELEGGGARLGQVLGSFQEFGTLDPEFSRDASFNEQLRNVMTKIQKIYQDTLAIISIKKDKDSTDGTIFEDLCFQMAQSYQHLPQVKIDWIQQLAEHHIEKGNFSEAGLCFQSMSELRSVNSKRSLSKDLEKAADNLAKGEFFEQSVRVYSRLIQEYERSLTEQGPGDVIYNKLNDVHKKVSEIYQKLSDYCSKQDPRLFGSYYRVGFYGKIFKEFDQQQFIYKMPKITRLAEMMDYLREKYAAQLGAKIKFHQNSNPIDASTLDPNEAVVQLTFVKPYFTEKEVEERASFVSLHTALSKFEFTTPFRKPGNMNANDLAGQLKRHTVLSVGNGFPYLTTRQQVIDVSETVWSPCKSAAENIRSQIDKISSLLDEEEKVHRTELTSVLQGSIMLQVHGGTIEICKTFFGNPEVLASLDFYEKEELRKTVREFLDVCQKGVQMFEKVCAKDDEQSKKLCTEFTKHLTKMADEMDPLLVAAAKSNPSMKPVKNKGVRVMFINMSSDGD